MKGNLKYQVSSTLIYWLILLMPNDALSQAHTDSLNNQKDIVDIASHLVGIKVKPKPDSIAVKPGRLLLSIIPAIGYTVANGGIASINSNVSFYMERDANLSTIDFSIQYSDEHQIIVPMVSNIWSKGNKVDFLGDYRYYKYPSLTYGLGGYSSKFNSDLIDYSYLKIYQEVLRHFNSYYYLGVGYFMDYHFNITEEGSNEDFESYNGRSSKTISSGPVAHFMYDSRKNINNPRQAFYLSLLYRYNNSVLGSTQNWQSVQLEIRKYFQLAPKLILALWSWNIYTFNGQTPYFDLPSTGWDTYSNTGRGYIQGRFRGSIMLYDEAEFRFGITKNGLLGGVLFANAESVSEWPSDKIERIEPGEGLGLRIKFNKYSNVNICVDYAFGIEGSKGFFFNLGEVF